ncbi:MOSC N-terminal beta barrel domain-containing protein [uncultured Pseudokineococcus sp.]|uniref:MOSC N-terminal beta barrel domain-containing protein n=1 Tax=uncultured Pseudokineococcus sp. TaxID=1642928 RepID=UPI002618990A|nr:MOSC N-terminal beta barrel domain-containing protein [uncultured Pseudokineococcus sp.]
MTSADEANGSGPHRDRRADQRAGRVVGAVAALTRYPLRSAAGEVVERVRCTAAGLAGDRGHVLVDASGRPLRGRDAPALASLRASLRSGRLVVADAGGSELDDAGLAAATGVPGAATAPAREHDAAPGSAAVAPVHLVSLGAEAGPDAQECDPDPRANVVLALDPVEGPGAERAWVGARLLVGDAVLVVTRTPRRCLGVYADVVVEGEVAVGDPVRLVAAGGPAGA